MLIGRIWVLIGRSSHKFQIWDPSPSIPYSVKLFNFLPSLFLPQFKSISWQGLPMSVKKFSQLLRKNLINNDLACVTMGDISVLKDSDLLLKQS